MAKDQQKSQTGQQVMSFTDEQALAYFEAQRWPNGPACPHCGSVNAYRMEGETTRLGLLACRDCRGHFTVTVGTVMEDTHLPLSVWAKAFHLMISSKKGISALQLQRNLGLGSYKTAWHLAHRIRLAMKIDRSGNKLSGDVQADETYVGVSRHSKNYRSDPNHPRKRGRGTTKVPVFALVDGESAHACPVDRVDGKTLGDIMRQVVDPSSRIVSDELNVYPKAAASFSDHVAVNHNGGEYVRPDGFHTNTAESFFSLFKRGHYGTFHHMSKKHMHRYCDEFAFRWSSRKMKDTERRDLAVAGIEGKRLMFYEPLGDA